MEKEMIRSLLREQEIARKKYKSDRSHVVL